MEAGVDGPAESAALLTLFHERCQQPEHQVRLRKTERITLKDDVPV